MGAEIMGPRSYDDLICTGGGVCRHQTDLLAAIFSEAGFRVRRATNAHFSTPDASHAWLEVDLTARGRLTTFVVDPANQTVKSLKDSEKDAALDIQSPDAKLWSNPARRTEHYKVQ